jgi:hypothetical protein
MPKSKRPPWKPTNPKARSGESTHLRPSEKAAARKSARKAGRGYPNLVDNMRVAAKRKGRGEAERVN